MANTISKIDADIFSKSVPPHYKNSNNYKASFLQEAVLEASKLTDY